MKHKQMHFGLGFRILLSNRFAQAAQMTLAPGESEGGPDNRHQGADQWLFVISGQGEAIINRAKYHLKAGVLFLIERGDFHEIRNTGRNLLRTLNVYVPPAYASDGDELPAGASEARRASSLAH